MHSTYFVKVSVFVVTLCLLPQCSRGRSFMDDVTLTPKQRTLLDEFKKRVSSRLPHDYMRSDIYLVKFLRTRNFNLEIAEEMLFNMVRWRKEQKMDTAKNEDWSDFEDLLPFYTEGRDNTGRTVLYFDIGGFDLRSFIIQGKGPRVNRYLNYAIDTACTLVRDLQDKYQNMTRGHLIVNIDGYNVIEHGCIPVILNIVINYEKYFPACADKIVLLNTPALFEPILQALKNLMVPDTREGLLVFGTNRKLYREKLSGEFDFSQLPPQIGGTKIYQGMDPNGV